MPQVHAAGKLTGSEHRLLFGDQGKDVALRASEMDRIRHSYATVLEGNIRMKALQAKQDATLQALKGSLSRPELASQVNLYLFLALSIFTGGSNVCDFLFWT